MKKLKFAISAEAVKQATPAIFRRLLFLFIIIEFVFHILGIGAFPIVKLETGKPANLAFIDDPYAGIKMKPNECYATRTGGFHLENEPNTQCLNSLGFRGAELNKNAVYKILFLGDSTTFGQGVFSDELIATGMLEKRLSFDLQPKRLKPFARKAVTVLNAGIPSHSVYQGLQIYWNYLIGLADWDYIIISYGWNYNYLTAGRNLIHIDHNLPVNKPTYYVRKVLRQIRSYNLLRSAFQKITKTGITKTNVYEKVYERLIKLAQERGAKVVIWPLIIPSKFKADKSKPMKDFFRSRQNLNKIAKKVALESGAVYLDMEAVFDRHGEQMEWVDSVHFGPQGHALLANELFDYLKKDIQ